MILRFAIYGHHVIGSGNNLGKLGWVLGFTIIVNILMLSGCTNSDTESSVVLQTPTSFERNLDVADKARNFSIILYHGDNYFMGSSPTFYQLLGHGKPVVINFWGAFCPPCRAEMPDLQRLHERFNDRVILFGLDVGPFVSLGSREDGQALMEELNITYPSGSTQEGGVIQDYQVFGIPTTVFIKANGDILRVWSGSLNREKMTELVVELIDSS
ncbi:TlpA family protein disulfide reductase [SAR202 cluster bacterium AD-804-J14_MRT_500m]|nr:TlpA family protein disulfide reductase [SAR202 cluster bacterium AD-804-J14_MRT_500m]